MSSGKTLAFDLEPVPNWGALPQGISFGGDATSVAVDSRNKVYVFNRGNLPVVVFDVDGRVTDAWGEGEFDSPHGIFADANDDIYLVDTGGHFVQKRSLDGKVLLTLGERGAAAPSRSGIPFNRPTDVVVHPKTGDIFVADGYGNARVHRFTPEGHHLASFGEPGADDGQLCLPHGIDFYDDDHLLVCDRENFRIQVFTIDGVYVDQWHSHRPAGVRRSRDGLAFFIAELGYPGQHGVPNVGCRVSVRDRDGRQIAVLGSPVPGYEPDQFFAPHSLSVDSCGSLYVAEVNYSYTVRELRRDPPRSEPISLRKWRLTGN